MSLRMFDGWRILREIFMEIAERLLQLVIPKRCVYCGLIRDPSLERRRKLTFEGRKFHSDWVLCEQCQDLFAFESMNICRRCGRFLHNQEFIVDGCPSCEGRTFWFDRVIPLGPYRGNLRQAIFMMKKRSGIPLTETFARLFYVYRAFPLHSVRPDVILPIPMHPFYHFVRGTNDAQVLAQELGKLLHIPVNERILKCRKLRLAQRAVSMEEREKNVEGMFAPFRRSPDRSRWLGKRALLVDDVMTTGSTLNEASRILKQELGFADVTVLVLARARGESGRRSFYGTVVRPVSNNVEQEGSYAAYWKRRRAGNVKKGASLEDIQDQKKIRTFNSNRKRKKKSKESSSGKQKSKRKRKK